MTLVPDKPFKTYDEQIDILVNKYGLIIKSKPFAKLALKSFTYYDLINGYKECFMENGNDHYPAGITLEFIYYFCLLDKNIQTTIFQFSAIIENSFKSKMAYILSDHFGVFQTEYLDPDNFYKSNNKILYSNIYAACTGIYSSGKPIPQPTKHYYQNHNHIPAWILFKNVSFSNVINLYQLLKKPEKEAVTNLLLPTAALSYEDKIDFIIAALNIVRNYRNKIAHNLKFVTYKNYNKQLSRNSLCTITPKTLLSRSETKKHKRGLYDIYADILCILHLLDDPILKYSFVSQLRSNLSDFQMSKNKNSPSAYDDYIQITNMPPDIIKRLEHYSEILIPKK